MSTNDLLRMDYIEWMQDAVIQAEDEWKFHAEEKYEIDPLSETFMDAMYKAWFFDMARWFLKDMTAYEFAEMKQHWKDTGIPSSFLKEN